MVKGKKVDPDKMMNTRLKQCISHDAPIKTFVSQHKTRSWWKSVMRVTLIKGKQVQVQERSYCDKCVMR